MDENDKKRIQIKPNFVSNTKGFFERIENVNKGDITVRDIQIPAVISSERTIETRPYKHVVNVIQSKATKLTSITTKMNQSKPGYDTSEL